MADWHSLQVSRSWEIKMQKVTEASFCSMFRTLLETPHIRMPGTSVGFASHSRFLLMRMLGGSRRWMIQVPESLLPTVEAWIELLASLCWCSPSPEGHLGNASVDGTFPSVSVFLSLGYSKTKQKSYCQVWWVPNKVHGNFMLSLK